MSTSFRKLSVSGDTIKIKIIDVEKKFGGGVIIKPDSVVAGDRVSTMEAIVLEVGPDAYDGRERAWCKVGDHVLVKRASFVEQADCVDEEDAKIRIVFDDSIIGVFNK